MNDDQFDDLLRDAAHSYNRPSGPPDTEALWAAIDRALPPEIVTPQPELTVVRTTTTTRRARPWGHPLWANPWLRAAAVLLLGVALGRYSARRPAAATPAVAAATRPDGAASSSPATVAERDATSEYLGRTEALLAALPEELQARRLDPSFQSRADALLLQTRLLLDSPAAADPALRALFDDLEVVLAQVVRLQGRDATRIDFLNEALQTRDVIPRLRDAVADQASAD